MVAKPVVSGSGTLRVKVPAGAKVFVNDSATTSTGAEREFVSHGLQQGQSYTYNVRVEYTLNGQAKVETQVATLTMSDDITLSFGGSSSGKAMVADHHEGDDEGDDEEEATARVADHHEDDEDGDSDDKATKLTLHVPADAQVTLAGSATRQTGAEREYLTTLLQAGESWDNYVVRVEAQVDGQTVTQEQQITLHGGKAHELTFDFSSLGGPKLASAN